MKPPQRRRLAGFGVPIPKGVRTGRTVDALELQFPVGGEGSGFGA